MKKKIVVLLAAIMCISLCACGGNDKTTAAKEDVNIQELIQQFGDDGDGKITWEEGSFPYFIDNKESFKLLSGAEIQENIVGTWTIKDKFGDEFKHTFNADNTAITMYDGTESNAHWLVEDDYFYFGTSANEIDTDRNTSMEIRQVEENVWIIYESDTGSYNGMEYEMTDPYAILYR